MKGLFLLDAAWLRQQKRLLMIFAGLIILYLSAEMGTFLIGFGTLFVSFILQKTILFDLSDSSAPFLFTLPFTRKAFVLEKYLLCICFPALLGAACTGLTLLLGYDQMEMLAVYIASLVMAVLISDLMIPLMIRFRENSTLYLISLGGLVGLLMAAASLDTVDLSWAAALFEPSVLGWVTAGGIGLLAALTAGSYALSLHWLSRQRL